MEINFNALEKEIGKRTGYSVTLKGEIKNDILLFESENLKDKAGIMATCYKKLQICNFGGGRCKDNAKMFWVPVDFSFQYEDGGSNGHNLFRALYDSETNEWIFK
jgi:hypothetical protein